MTASPAAQPLDGDDPRGRRRLWQIIAGLAVVVVGLAVFAWPQGDDGVTGGPLNAIAEAAARTQREPGLRGAMRATVTSPVPSESLTMTGPIALDEKMGRSRMVMTVEGPKFDDPVEMEIVGEGTMTYMRADLFGELPDGKEWIGLDVAFGADLDLPAPAGDAEGELELLEAATGDVRKLGKEDVRGVSTTRYRGEVSVAESAERLREEGADDLASLVEKENTPVQVEAWIDADGLVRRMRVVASTPEEDGKGPQRVDMRMDFFEFGLIPEIRLPKSSEVHDITELAREEVGLSESD